MKCGSGDIFANDTYVFPRLRVALRADVILSGICYNVFTIGDTLYRGRVSELGMGRI